MQAWVWIPPEIEWIRLYCLLGCVKLWYLSYLSPTNNRICRYHLFGFSHCQWSLKEAFDTFSSSTRLTMCLMFLMRGCVAGDVWSPWWCGLGKKRPLTGLLIEELWDMPVRKWALVGKCTNLTGYRMPFCPVTKRVFMSLCFLINLTLCALLAIWILLKCYILWLKKSKKQN